MSSSSDQAARVTASQELSVVSVAELRSVTAKLLDAAEVMFGPVIELGADHYWLVESDDAFDLTQEPIVCAGQLSDDLESVRAVGGAGPESLGHDLDHLLGLLRRVSALARP